jgi:hypothetical protein
MHARAYVPRVQIQARNWYFLSEDHVVKDLLCGACTQSGRKDRHGGLVLSEESRKKQTVLFQAFGGYRLTAELLKHLEKIWPKG